MRIASRAWRIARELLLAKRAATSMELALVGPILVLIVLIVIENGMMLFAQAALDEATTEAARQIQIGNVTSQTAFQNAVCSYVSSLFNCNNLQFYVASSSVAFPTPILPLSNGTFALQLFSTGSGGDYVVAEVAYNRSYVSPWLITLGNSWILLSTSAFQNEPFS